MTIQPTDDVSSFATLYHTTVEQLVTDNPQAIGFEDLDVTVNYRLLEANTEETIANAIDASLDFAGLTTVKNNLGVDVYPAHTIIPITLNVSSKVTVAKALDALNQQVTAINNNPIGVLEPFSTQHLLKLALDQLTALAENTQLTLGHLLENSKPDLDTDLETISDIAQAMPTSTSSRTLKTSATLNTLLTIGKRYATGITSIVENNSAAANVVPASTLVTVPNLIVLESDTALSDLTMNLAAITGADARFVFGDFQNALTQFKTVFGLFGEELSQKWEQANTDNKLTIRMIASDLGLSVAALLSRMTMPNKPELEENEVDNIVNIRIAANSILLWDAAYTTNSAMSFDSFTTDLKAAFPHLMSDTADDIADILAELPLTIGVTLTVKPDPLIDWATANQNIVGILADNQSFTWLGRDYSTGTSHTLQTLAAKLKISAAKLVGILDDATYFQNLNRLIEPPNRYHLASELSTATYPEEAIFPVTVYLTIARDANLIHPDFVNVPEVQSSQASLAPETGTANAEAEDDFVISVQDFANAFEETFPDLKLAVGRDELGETDAAKATSSDDPGNQLPLWGVRLSSISLGAEATANDGIAIAIDENSTRYYALPPLSTELLAGTVDNTQYTDIDIDAWFRDFLAQVDHALDPVELAKGYPDNAEQIDALLDQKQVIADRLASRIDLIFDEGAKDDDTAAKREAIELLRQKLLSRLSNAYDLETIVQLRTDKDISTSLDAWKAKYKQLPKDGVGITPNSRFYPRIVSQGVIETIISDTEDDVSTTTKQSCLDTVSSDKSGNHTDFKKFTLSESSTVLDDGSDYLTFVFNTPTPAKADALRLSVKFKFNELEYDRKGVVAIREYVTSHWLRLVNELTHDEAITLTIPIPLRSYPLPPSLIQQTAINDVNSLENIKQIREWTYTNCYERPQIAQDKINIHLIPNAPDVSNSGSSTQAVSTQADLFVRLATFRKAYGESLQNITLDADFVQQVTAIATALGNWHTVTVDTPVIPNSYISIEENLLTDENNIEFLCVELESVNKDNQGATIRFEDTPDLDLYMALDIPGYTKTPTVTPIKSDNRHVVAEYSVDETNQHTNLGASDLPDRTVEISNLDIIDHQNASSKIWLMRNDDLVAGKTTNPAFIYRTPIIQYTSPVFPFLVNDEPWDIHALRASKYQGESAMPQILRSYLDWILDTVLPMKPKLDYAVQIGCQYGFNVFFNATDDPTANDDFTTRIPILLGLPQEMDHTLLDEQQVLGKHLEQIVGELMAWYSASQPEETVVSGAHFAFQLRLYSRLDDTNPTAPLLQIDNLRVYLKHISDLPELNT